MSDTAAKPRPQFRNIGLAQVAFSYRLPLAGKLSILHRVSGVAIPLSALGHPAAVRGQRSRPRTFAAVAAYAGNPIVKLVLLVLIWGYLHHFCAGIRYLLLDLHIGLDKQSAKKSAGVVFGISLALTVVFALKLFGVL